MQTSRSVPASAAARFALIVLAALCFCGWPASQAHAASKRLPSVLFVYSGGSPGFAPDVQSKLFSSGQFGQVTLFNASAATPSLATMLTYDAIFVASDFPGFVDPTTLGNNLADYVDAGGGVVNATFSVGSITPPAGRWNPGYLSMVAGGAQVSGSITTLNLASITNQNHPILIGVGSFSGGTSSFRINQPNVVAGATVVARWSDGNVLVATGPLPGRADLNFYPASSAARSDLWDTSTDGIKLMVNALLYTMRPRVLIAGSPGTPSWNDDVKAKVRGTGLVGIVNTFDTSSGTPTLATLQQYDSVLAFTDAAPLNSTALGNVLADFVDLGGGVVASEFAHSTNWRITGRWAGTYELITATGTFTSGANSLGAVTYSGHPAMSAVATFNGGVSSYRPPTNSLNSGAFNIAQWADGRPLVVASTKFSNRMDLGFYPPSSTVNANFWQVGTDGAKLMANALVYVCKPYVACVAADSTLMFDPVAKLIASRRFSGVATVDAGGAPPAAATLKPLNALMTWSNAVYNNPTTLGNNLADYVDAGAGVVVAVFANVQFSIPQGRWPTQGYEIVPSPGPGFTVSGPQAFLGAVLEPANPINSFVRKFDGGTASYRATSNPLLRGREVLRWSDGRMLASVHNTKKRVDLGMYPGSSGTGLGAGAWNQRTDGTWLMANALEYSVYHKPCPGDLNGDGQVDDTDFVLFANYYDNLVDPRGDLNGDGLTEDTDFVIFASAYDALVCP